MPFLFICKSGPSGVLGAMVAIGITALTAGAGAPVAGAIGLSGNAIAVGAAQGLVSAGATQLTLGTLSNNFNPLEGVKSTVTRDGLTSLATSAITSGVMGGLGWGSAPGASSSIPEFVAYSTDKALVNAGVNVALGQDAGEAFKNAGTNFLFDVVGRVGANQIGQLYQLGQGRIDYATHKALHAMLGAGLGALKGDIAAGAIGGAVSEIIAESLVNLDDVTDRVKEKVLAEDVPLGSERFYALVQDELRSAQYFGKLGAAVTVALAGHDVDVGVNVATNALENNLALVVPLMIGGRILLQAAITGSRYALGVGSAVLVGKGASDLVDAQKEQQATTMDTAPEGAQWVDEGFEVEERGPQVLVTPFPEEVPDIEGYQPADIQSRDQGFEIPERVDTSILSMGYDLDGNYVSKGKGRLIEAFEDASLMGEYRKVRGHHVHAKKAFEGHPNYDPQKGFSISEELMREHGIVHRKVTSAQQKLFLELGRSNRDNTLLEHTRIAVEALMEGGATREIARLIVSKSLKDLKNKDVKEPTNIPWFKERK